MKLVIAVVQGEDAQRTSEALGARHRADIEKWWPLVKAANIKAE